MKKQLLVVSISSLIVLLFDTLASITSRNFQIEYSSFIFGSILIYICTGFFGAKYGNLPTAVCLAAIVGLVESTIGWYISIFIGPGRPEFELNFANTSNVVIFAVILAAFFGFIGASINHVMKRYFA